MPLGQARTAARGQSLYKVANEGLKPNTHNLQPTNISFDDLIKRLNQVA